MSLLEKIKEIVDRDLLHTYPDWNERPESINQIELGLKLPYLKIDLLIKDADQVECQISSSEYVINCKQWMRENNFQEAWTEVYLKREASKEEPKKYYIIGDMETSAFATEYTTATTDVDYTVYLGDNISSTDVSSAVEEFRTAAEDYPLYYTGEGFEEIEDEAELVDDLSEDST